MTGYIIFRLLIALIIASIGYILDRRFGTGLYRWWYGMTHEHPLPADSHRGFIHSRSTATRVTFAVIVASLISAIALVYGHENLLLELMLWLISIPVILAAFLLGPRIHSTWEKRRNVYDAVDKWERGEIDITDELKSKSAEIAAGVRDTFTPATKEPSPEPVPAAQAEPAPPATAASPEPEPEIDPQERVNKFINRGRS